MTNNKRSKGQEETTMLKVSGFRVSIKLEALVRISYDGEKIQYVQLADHTCVRTTLHAAMEQVVEEAHREAKKALQGE